MLCLHRVVVVRSGKLSRSKRFHIAAVAAALSYSVLSLFISVNAQAVDKRINDDSPYTLPSGEFYLRSDTDAYKLVQETFRLRFSQTLSKAVSDQLEIRIGAKGLVDLAQALKPQGRVDIQIGAIRNITQENGNLPAIALVATLHTPIEYDMGDGHYQFSPPDLLETSVRFQKLLDPSGFILSASGGTFFNTGAGIGTDNRRWGYAATAAVSHMITNNVLATLRYRVSECPQTNCDFTQSATMELGYQVNRDNVVEVRLEKGLAGTDWVEAGGLMLTWKRTF